MCHSSCYKVYRLEFCISPLTDKNPNLPVINPTSNDLWGGHTDHSLKCNEDQYFKSYKTYMKMICWYAVFNKRNYRQISQRIALSSCSKCFTKHHSYHWLSERIQTNNQFPCFMRSHAQGVLNLLYPFSYWSVPVSSLGRIIFILSKPLCIHVQL